MPAAVAQSKTALLALYAVGPVKLGEHNYTCAARAVTDKLEQAVPAFHRPFPFLFPLWGSLREVMPAQIVSLLPSTMNGAMEVLLCHLTGIGPYTHDAACLALADHLERSPAIISALEKSIRALLTRDWSATVLEHVLSDLDSRTWSAQVKWEADRAMSRARERPVPATESTPSGVRAQVTPGQPMPEPADNLADYRDEDQPWWKPFFPTDERPAEQLRRFADQIDVVIMTATEVERDGVLRWLTPLPSEPRVLQGFVGPETYFLGRFGEFNVVVTKCRMGSAGPGSAALAAEQAQREWRPRAIIMVGIAFGKDPTKQRIGDVFVASEIICYEPQRVGAAVVYRGPVPPCDPILLNRFENAIRWDFRRPDGIQSACRYGPLLSGEKLVDDPEFKASLFASFPQAIGGEMEGAGLGAAAIRFAVPWIVVKAICDWGDGEKNKKYQPLAAAAAASLVHHVLSHKGSLHGLRKPVAE